MGLRGKRLLSALGRRIDGAGDRELAAGLLSGIAIGGAAIGFVTYLLPHPQGTDYLLPSIAFAASIIAGVVLWRRRARVGWAPIAIVTALGAVVVTIAMLSVPDRTGAYATYYVWLGIFAFYFLPTSWAFAQVAWIAVLYGVATAIDAPPGAVEQWANGVATTLGVGLLVLALRVRIRGLVGRLETAAATDELTGLPNRRAFDEQLGRELERCNREGGSFAMAMLDLDHFKQLNDTAGHPAGDHALRRLAGVIRAEVRAMDWPARVGGDEFAVLLPGADREEALRIADRLRAAIEAEFAAGPVPLRASVGIATGAGAGLTPERLLVDADRALYAAKRLGGDHVADGEQPGEAEPLPAANQVR